MDYYTIDRIMAAKILNVSTRTLDRYITKNYFSSMKKKGKIFFNSRDINEFVKNRDTESIDNKFDNNIHNIRHENFDNTKIIYEEKEGKLVAKDMSKDLKNSDSQNISQDIVIYKKMYETIQNLFKNQQTQLQEAYKRIGKLENLIAESNSKRKTDVPLLSLKIKDKEITEVKNKLEFLIQENQTLEKQISFFEISKAVYLFITIIIIVFGSILFAIH